MGPFPGWWLGEDDDRVYKPWVSQARWHRELQSAGFSGADVTAYDIEPPYNVAASYISRPLCDTPIDHEIWLLTKSATPSQWTKVVQSALGDNGYTTNLTTLHEAPPKGKFIICLLDSECGPTLNKLEDTYPLLQSYVGKAEECRILWVTESTTLSCSMPLHGLIHGVARTLRAELLLDFSVLEVPSWDGGSANAMAQVCEKIQISRAQSLPDPEYEFVLDGREIKIGRYRWTPLMEELSSPPIPNAPRKLDLTAYGLLDTLQWIQKEQFELAAGHVEVQMEYVGLNFKDMMVSMGFFGSKEDLGLEGSGSILRVGPEVEGFSVGDRVVLMHPGALGSKVMVPQDTCIHLPEKLSMADAATMLTAYVTVMYSLLEVGCLKKGQVCKILIFLMTMMIDNVQSVLVHSACGGVGLAAVQVCQAVGAEIYNTVGNDVKVSDLMETYGLARDRIYNSRNTSFQANLMHATAGRGMDIVLNSLSVGKEAPESLKSMLTLFSDWYVRGSIGPIHPVKVFEAVDIVSAFRYMQAGTHMGKILVHLPTSSETLPLPVVKKFPSFRADASYLLVGGLGGIGRYVSSWLVEQGAREIVFLSRSAGISNDDQKFIHELETQGCHVICAAGDVTNRKDVEAAVDRRTRPLAGVLQMAIDLKASWLLYEEWEAALAPKLAGTWNLHCATEQDSLDFFVVFGSIAGVCSNTGQANYAAATTYLEALTRYRRQRGLPSSVLHLGVVGDVGVASHNARFLQRVQSIALHVLNESEVVDALAAAINISPPNSASATGSIAVGLAHTKRRSDLPKEIFLGGRDARFAIYPNLESTGGAIGGDKSSQVNALKALLAEIQRDPSLTGKQETEIALIKELGRFVSLNLTGQTQDPSQDNPDDTSYTEAMAEIAVDSLMAIEVRNWLRRSLGVEIPTVEINRAGTLRGLVKFVLNGLGEKYDQSSTLDAAAG
ncbi:unnamed protein product [Penicillium salamii]|uniref:Carrier domain-containing protein n=1 Tax=Penicillium salamii TaxID=1612424 RepID=A0A9W4NH71_9EURO|nr:unnamed protein product [Penicillium salamii]